MRVKIYRTVYSKHHVPLEYIVKMVPTIAEAKRFTKGKENKLSIAVWIDDKWQHIADNK